MYKKNSDILMGEVLELADHIKQGKASPRYNFNALSVRLGKHFLTIIGWEWWDCNTCKDIGKIDVKTADEDIVEQICPDCEAGIPADDMDDDSDNI